jgi:hypothetical protein
MCLFKKKNSRESQKQEIPPEPPLSGEAIAVVWREDKEEFSEVFFKYGAYVFHSCRLDYDDFIGYYWYPAGSGAFVSFYDTPEKAIQAAENFMRGKEL